MGTQLLIHQRGTAPKFSAHICCGQMAAWIKMSLGIQLGLGPGDFVLDGDPAVLPQTGAEPPPQISAHVYCGQTARWIKMPLGTKVGLRTCDSVLDGGPAPLSTKGVKPFPNFRPFLLWPNGWMHQDATWCGGRFQPRGLRVRWGPSPPPKRERSPLPNFRPISTVAKRLDACTKVPLGADVGLSPGDFVLDGDPAPLATKKAQPECGAPICGPCLLWQKGWMDQDGTWHGGRPWSSPHYARWGHSSPP